MSGFRPIPIFRAGRAIRAPKTPAVPKVRKIEVIPAIGGAKVTHHFNLGNPKQFVFNNPAKLKTHLERTIATEWLHPNAQAEAQKIEKETNTESNPWQT